MQAGSVLGGRKTGLMDVLYTPVRSNAGPELVLFTPGGGKKRMDPPGVEMEPGAGGGRADCGFCSDLVPSFLPLPIICDPQNPPTCIGCPRSHHVHHHSQRNAVPSARRAAGAGVTQPHTLRAAGPVPGLPLPAPSEWRDSDFP